MGAISPMRWMPTPPATAAALRSGQCFRTQHHMGGQIVIDDNGTVSRSVVALVSHGADGHGAWLPLNAASGTGTRLNTGSTDTDQNMVNAHAASATPTFPSNHSTITSLQTDLAGNSVTFVNKLPTSTLTIWSSIRLHSGT